MSSLLDRLKAIQKVHEKPRKAISDYSLEELSKMVVSFGTKVRGLTFLDVWNTDQQWVKWVVSHLHSSKNYDHQLFLQFASLMIERYALTGQKVDAVEDPEDDIHEIAEMAADLSHLAELLADFQTKFARLAAKTIPSEQ